MKTLIRTALIAVAAVVTLSLTNCASNSDPATIGFYHGQAQPPIPASNANGGWTQNHPAGQL